jgi:hypothetical protein
MELFDNILNFFDSGSDALSSGFGDVIDVAGDVGGGILKAGGGVLSAISAVTNSGLASTLGDLLYEGVSWYSATEAAKAYDKAGQSAADVYGGNADLFSAEAAQVRQRAQQQQVRMQYNGLRFMATQRTNYLKSGVTLEGSPLIVIKETNDLIKMSINDMMSQAESQASNLEKQAANEKLKAKAAQDAAAAQAKSVVIGQAGKTVQSVFGLS